MTLRGKTIGAGSMLVAGVGGLAMVLGGLLAASALMPTQIFGEALLQSTTYEARAAEGLEEADAAILAQARDDTRSGLALNPHNGLAWLRLAWIESQLNDARLSPAAIEALQRSFDVAPYGPQVTSWRITFLLDHWPETPESIRTQLKSEITASWPARAKVVIAAVRKSKNKTGRLAGRVIMVRLRQENQ